MRKCFALCSVLVATVLFAGPAHAQFGGLGKAVPKCSNDMGAKAGIEQVNGFISNSYNFVMTAAEQAFLALGKKEMSEKISAQLRDSKQDTKSKETTTFKGLTDTTAELNKTLEENKAAQLDDNAKSVLSIAVEKLYTGVMHLSAATVLSVPVGKNAKDAIAADKMCSTSLTPVIDTVAGLAKTTEALTATSKSLNAFSKAQGLAPLSENKKKEILKSVAGENPDLQKLGETL